MQSIPRHRGVWNSVLWITSNNTGLLQPDPVAEAWLRQLHSDYVVPSIMRGKTLLGSVLDPIWLWPVEGRVDKDVLMGDLNTCDVHMHNLKSIKLTNVQVRSLFHIHWYYSMYVSAHTE